MKRRRTILLASANVLNNVDYLKHLKDERDAIYSVLNTSFQKGEIHIEPEPECSFAGLFRKFNAPQNKDRISILHYSGHSSDEVVVIESSRTGNSEISSKNFVEFLRLQKELEVVFLNSCCSASIGELLLESGVGAVIETTTLVGDKEAAQFAIWFYEGLGAGKSLLIAFEQAVSLFHETFDPNNAHTKEETQSSLRGIKLRKSSKECIWQLAYKNREFIENWYLVERIFQKFYHPDIRTRVLTIYEDEIGNHRYYKLIQGLFTDRPDFFHYSLSDLQAETDINPLIDETQMAIFILSEGFPLFWSKLDWIMSALSTMDIIFIGCDGDVENAFKKVIEDLNLPKDSFIAPSGVKYKCHISY